ncbi:MAG TPA: hypothetical protein VFK10_17500 [Burkholderiaceae bacterium]|nr:hypothetical protein [Burkholderiaceae bacterium]
MLAFRTHRCLRTTVWVTLLGWLFALTAGVVNACVLSIPSAATLGLSAESHIAHSSQAVADTEHHDHAPVAHHKHGQNSANDSCLKFCDDESSALSKGSASALDLGVALVAAVALPSAVAPIAHVGAELSLQRPTAQGPPLVIRLLRLTL